MPAWAGVIPMKTDTEYRESALKWAAETGRLQAELSQARAEVERLEQEIKTDSWSREMQEALQAIPSQFVENDYWVNGIKRMAAEVERLRNVIAIVEIDGGEAGAAARQICAIQYRCDAAEQRATKAEAEVAKLTRFYDEIVAECGHDQIVAEYRKRGELLCDEARLRKEAEAETEAIIRDRVNPDLERLNAAVKNLKLRAERAEAILRQNAATLLDAADECGEDRYADLGKWEVQNDSATLSSELHEADIKLTDAKEAARQ